MLVKVRNFIDEHKLFAPGSRIVVGVSGGPDSMALLHVLAALIQDWHLQIVAVHVHHGLRKEADADMALVAEGCRKLNIPLETARVDISRLAAEEKRSLEEMGRISRYRFFEEVRQRFNAICIATAHHQEDAAESVLLHLLRGSGTRGMRGILPINGRVVRPLLSVGKQEILDYLEQHQIAFAVDQSNASNTYTRNRIRNHLMPILARDYNPQIVSSLNQLSDIIKDEYELLEILTDQWLKQAVLQQRGDQVEVAAEFLLASHPALQRRGVLQLCQQVGGKSGWEKKDIDSVIDLAGKMGSNHFVRLKKGVVVRKVYQRLLFSRAIPGMVQFCYSVEVPGEVHVRETGQRYTFAIVAAQLHQPEPETTWLDWDCMIPPLYIRSRQAGDRISLSGLGGRKKLKDFFIDAKIPWERRHEIPILASDNEVYAILGYRVAAQAECHDNSRQLLVIKKA